ncbi:hypothetical protein [Paraburkholderia bannensis]|uniref:hypothetical protein n=1 Tax=Paraburkholderia bannensis TaxID=765414 RepID=UPI002AB7EF4B|nr:hypothetical protein [Paraburkholderia bannensis]
MLRSLKLWILPCVLVPLVWFFSRPVIVLHYAPDARQPVAYFFNENNDITRGELTPGQTKKFYMPMFPSPDAFVDFSLPLASRDGVDIKPPYSRVDVYIDAATKIERTDVKHGFLDRF